MALHIFVFCDFHLYFQQYFNQDKRSSGLNSPTLQLGNLTSFKAFIRCKS